MVRKALILHCWYGNPKGDWYPWIKKELEKKGYKVFAPDLPTMRTNLPDMEKQLAVIGKTVEVDEDTMVIGHSLGAVLALRLAEKESFQKMFLVSGWDFNDLTKEHRLFWPDKINHSEIIKNVNEVYVFHSDNDPYITACQAEDMSKRLNGRFILIKGMGHFTKKGGVTKIPEILNYV